MLCKRKIELHKGASGLPQNLIPQELLVDCGRASRILARAQDQVREQQRLFEAQREEQLERAGLEFWQRANAQLARWEREHQAMNEGLECTARTIANQAISYLLDEVVPQQRLAALLKQLLAAQVASVKATLTCHPSDRECVERWLKTHAEVPWHLRLEPAQEVQTLILETEEGDFRIDWASAIDRLLIPK